MTPKKEVFVIMPFSDTSSASEAEWTETYEHIFAPAVRHWEYECTRASPGRGSLIASIIDELRTAPIVLADLTDQNANVFYELGVRHALSKRTILVSQRADDIPSDLRGYWFHVYGRTPRDVADFRGQLGTLIRDIELHPDKCDSPIADILEKDNAAMLRSDQKASIRKLTALHTEFTAIKSQLASKEPIASTPCLDLLLHTLYVDPGSDVLREAYEIRGTLGIYSNGLESMELSSVFISRLSERVNRLHDSLLEVRRELLLGRPVEPDSITMLSWERPESDSSLPSSCASFLEPPDDSTDEAP